MGRSRQVRIRIGMRMIRRACGGMHGSIACIDIAAIACSDRASCLPKDSLHISAELSGGSPRRNLPFTSSSNITFCRSEHPWRIAEMCESSQDKIVPGVYAEGGTASEVCSYVKRPEVTRRRWPTSRNGSTTIRRHATTITQLNCQYISESVRSDSKTRTQSSRLLPYDFILYYHQRHIRHGN